MKMNNWKLGIGLFAAFMFITLTIALGCRQSESQAVREIATQAMRDQSAQNERMATTTQELVTADARAREELIESHARLQDSLQVERANLDQQQSDLNELREEVELDRRRAPVIAEAIHVIGGIFVCLSPLALAAYIFYSVNQTSAADEAHLVNEVLIGELTSETPRLLAPTTGETTRAITDRRESESTDFAEDPLPF